MTGKKLTEIFIKSDRDLVCAIPPGDRKLVKVRYQRCVLLNFPRKIPLHCNIYKEIRTYPATIMYDRNEHILQGFVALERRYKQDMFRGIVDLVWDEPFRVAEDGDAADLAVGCLHHFDQVGCGDAFPSRDVLEQGALALEGP